MDAQPYKTKEKASTDLLPKASMRSRNGNIRWPLPNTYEAAVEKTVKRGMIERQPNVS